MNIIKLNASWVQSRTEILSPLPTIGQEELSFKINIFIFLHNYVIQPDRFREPNFLSPTVLALILIHFMSLLSESTDLFSVILSTAKRTFSLFSKYLLVKVYITPSYLVYVPLVYDMRHTRHCGVNVFMIHNRKVLLIYRPVKLLVRTSANRIFSSLFVSSSFNPHTKYINNELSPCASVGRNNMGAAQSFVY